MTMIVTNMKNFQSNRRFPFHMHHFSALPVVFIVNLNSFKGQDGNIFLLLQIVSPKKLDTEKTLHRKGVSMFNKSLPKHVLCRTFIHCFH